MMSSCCQRFLEVSQHDALKIPRRQQGAHPAPLKLSTPDSDKQRLAASVLNGLARERNSEMVAGRILTTASEICQSMVRRGSSTLLTSVRCPLRPVLIQSLKVANVAASW